MKKNLLIFGILAILLVVLVILIATQSNVLGAAPFWANISPTEIPPQAKTQLAEVATTRTAQAALNMSLPRETSVHHPTTTSWLPNPTFYPPVKATQLSAMVQTQQAGELLPTPDFQEDYPGFIHPSSEDILAGKRVGKLAGYGILTDIPAPIVQHGPNKGKYVLNDGGWEEDRLDVFITVFSGHLKNQPDQGVITVSYLPHYQHTQASYYFQSPQPVGDLHISGAIGERIILNSAQGTTLYFDIPALKFVDNLEQPVPTATPAPTIAPLALPSSTDDAPDTPSEVFSYSPINEGLRFTLSSPTDKDWFHFFSRKPGTISVSLVELAGDYGLRVVRLVDDPKGGEIVGEDISPGQGKKEVTLPDAPAGDYLVRVWGLDGSSDAGKPYLLRFDAPIPEKVTPILECVAENGDGTYTAHFGYDNPNPFVVVVNANNDNAFHPGPVFRTGQPEAFAPGRVTDWFGMLFDGEGLTWVLDGHAVTANRNSPHCP